ncbi:MAG: DUF5060 domain-containing protein [Verrucomicrobiota bacterium]
MKKFGSLLCRMMLGALVLSSIKASAQNITIGGDLMQWHNVILDLEAISSSESASPNPFMDYRFNVEFTGPSGQKFLVPGYFATDGQGGDSGNIWRAHLNPDEMGQWSYEISFREGSEIAVNLASNPGSAVSAYDGLTGIFTVQPSNKTGEDFRAPSRGMLVNRGHHYLTFGGSGLPFVYAGPGIPENLLGFRGFTNTTIGIGHEFTAHVSDWNNGDPDWDNGSGRGLIGAINYIAEEGGNAIYIMSNTIGGDAKDIFMHPTSNDDKERYDLLKLDQWDIALAHAQSLGIFIHLHLAEHESGNMFYYGEADSEMRQLYFRMLVARYGHYNGLKWNIMEETEWSANERSTQAAYLKAIDPYDHPVAYQVGGAGIPFNTYDSHYGDPNFDNGSFQGSNSSVSLYNVINQYRDNSANGGQPWTITWDEPQKIENNNDFDLGYPLGRRQKMWPAITSGAAGFMWYIQQDGGGHGFDQRIEDFSIMKDSLNWCRYIRAFFEPLPLLEMVPDKDIAEAPSEDAFVLKKEGELYAIFSEAVGANIMLDLSGVTGEYNIRWYNPRTGLYHTGTKSSVAGGSEVNLGSAPFETDQDWAILVENNASNTILFVIGGEGTAGGPECGGALGTNVACKSEHRGSIFNTSTSGGNHGWAQMADLLRAEGFTLVEIEEGAWDAPAPVDFANLDLSLYSAIVLGSNNNLDYTAAQIDAIEQYVRGGGSIMFISDANFGPTNLTAMQSDQLFMDRFGLTMNRDAGTYTLDRPDDFTTAGLTHPILDGVDSFDGEGVSPITIDTTLPSGASYEVLAVPANVSPPEGGSRPVTANDGVIVAGFLGNGRVVGFFDRNTFFNQNGAGSNVFKNDNEVLAVNLFTWLLQGDGDTLNAPPVVNAGSDISLLLPVNSVALDGSASDSDDDSLTYLWSGPAAVTFIDPTDPKTTIVITEPGSYTLTLSVNDGVNPIQTDLVNVSSNALFVGSEGFQEINGVVSMEAENGNAGANWRIRNDTDYPAVTASGGQFIEINPSQNRLVQSISSASADDIISYPFTIQTDGDYRFWMRFLTTSNQDDSFFWRIDDGPWTIKNDEFGMGAWYQVDIPQNGSFVGEHTLEITYRENGTFLDKFVIQLVDSPNPGDVASGEGPSETPTPGGNSFTVFQEEYFGPDPDPQTTAAGADFENDGLPNVLEHLLGLNPTVADWDGSTMRININNTGAQPLIDFSFSRDLLATGYYIDVEHSYDLSTWNRLTISSSNFNTSSLGTNLDQYTVTIPTDGSVGNFLRLTAVATNE